MDVSSRRCVFKFYNSIKSEVTKQVYEYNLKLFINFYGIDKFEDLIGQQDRIIEYLMSLREKKLSYNSICIPFLQDERHFIK